MHRGGNRGKDEVTNGRVGSKKAYNKKKYCSTILDATRLKFRFRQGHGPSETPTKNPSLPPLPHFCSPPGFCCISQVADLILYCFCFHIPFSSVCFLSLLLGHNQLFNLGHSLIQYESILNNYTYIF